VPLEDYDMLELFFYLQLSAPCRAHQ